MTTEKQNMTEQELIDRCLKKDARAQKMLYDKLGPKMMGVCLRYSSSLEEAQDVLQDGFIKVFEKLGAYTGKGSFEGWARRVFVNTALDAIRRNKNLKLNQQIEDVAYSLKSNDFILESLAAEDLLKVLQQIPHGYRTVFNLYVIEGYSHKEIAEMLDITVSTSKSQFSRAKALLRKMIEELGIHQP